MYHSLFLGGPYYLGTVRPVLTRRLPYYLFVEWWNIIYEYWY